MLEWVVEMVVPLTEIKSITLNDAVITSKKRELKTRKNRFRSNAVEHFWKITFPIFFKKAFRVHWLETTSAAFSAALYRLLYGPFMLMPCNDDDEEEWDCGFSLLHYSYYLIPSCLLQKISPATQATTVSVYVHQFEASALTTGIVL